MGLETLRTKIDRIDEKILKLISERNDVVREISEFKEKNRIQVRHEKREEEVIQRARDSAVELNVDPDAAEKIMTILIEEGCRIQEK